MKNSETSYREVTLPGGTFRMYDDRPYVWVQVLQDGEKSLVEKSKKPTPAAKSVRVTSNALHYS